MEGVDPVAQPEYRKDNKKTKNILFKKVLL